MNRSKLLKTRRRQRVATLRHIRWVELFVELLLHSEVLSNSLFISTCCSHIIASGRELQTGKTAAPACVVSCNVNSAFHFEVCYELGRISHTWQELGFTYESEYPRDDLRECRFLSGRQALERFHRAFSQMAT